MKFGALFFMGGMLALAGCSSSASGTDPTSTPASKPAATSAPTSSTTSPSATAAVAVAVHHTGNSYADGTADLKAKNYGTAASEFRASIKAKVRVPESYAGLGAAYVGLFKYPVAYQAFKNAAQLQPKNPGYLYNTAYTALMSQNYHVAVNYATAFLHLRPDSVPGYHVRLLAYGSLLKPKDQLHDARQIVRLAKGSPQTRAQAFNDLGIAYGNSRKYVESIQAFSQAIQLDPTVLSFYTNRGVAETLSKQMAAALSDFEQARTLARDPGTQRQLDLQIKSLKQHMHQ